MPPRMSIRRTTNDTASSFRFPPYIPALLRTDFLDIMAETLIKNGRIVDPSQRLDRIGDLLLRDGKVVGIDVPATGDAQVIDATDRLVVPGLIDINTQLQEPGWEEDETIATGTMAALAGGFTSIACGPNTDPPLDSQGSVEFVRHQAMRADHCNVFVLACVSKNRDGQELAELGFAR